MHLLPQLTDKEMADFEDSCFRNWLNRIDARIDYDNRRALASVIEWRHLFDFGYDENGAIKELHYVRDNKAFCGC